MSDEHKYKEFAIDLLFWACAIGLGIWFGKFLAVIAKELMMVGINY
jgi:hypothetical protein